ncbi:uncharacterized protein EHS24_009216 [Apiotrichum porosum]|uniref:Uncharacterized protein n=1 Tax=Apiotrichum porosum TaxID=105984 RepID=A0A427XP74_9TREE|nr:uncharacterized protein EHS24_009216 [Apiotrichum porosum]RSH80632.1 hypothetical protein EHS24_009216 [Apiotrichum porosum]
MTEIKSTAQIKIDGELHDGRTEGLFPAGADLRDALRHVRLLDLQDLGGLGLVDAIGVNASTVRMSLMPTYPTPAAELEPVAWPAHLTPSTVWVTVLPNNPAPVISIQPEELDDSSESPTPAEASPKSKPAHQTSKTTQPNQTIQTPPPRVAPPRPWDQAEYTQLREYVTLHGSNMESLRKAVPGRDANDAYLAWINVVQPACSEGTVGKMAT